MLPEDRHRVPDPHAEASREREALAHDGLLERIRFPDGHVEYRVTKGHGPRAA